MINLWQTQWHGIQFKDIRAALSCRNLPSVDFYSKFYGEFNRRYKNINDLDPDWVSLKLRAAALITKILKDSHDEPKVLSLGAGIGIIEGEMLSTFAVDLYVQEVSEEPFTFFLDDILEPQKKLVGDFPDIVPEGLLFDFIILGGIEYLFADDELVYLLEQVKDKLAPGGKCVFVSWSLYQPSYYLELKNRVKVFLCQFGFGRLGQLWGYLRTNHEIDSIVSISGMTVLQTIEDNKTPWRTSIKIISIG